MHWWSIIIAIIYLQSWKWLIKSISRFVCMLFLGHLLSCYFYRKFIISIYTSTGNKKISYSSSSLLTFQNCVVLINSEKSSNQNCICCITYYNEIYNAISRTNRGFKLIWSKSIKNKITTVQLSLCIRDQSDYDRFISLVPLPFSSSTLCIPPHHT